MAGEIFTIVKQGKDYRVFRGDAVGEPMDEPDEDKLYGWLRNRGFSTEQALKIIHEMADKGPVRITTPRVKIREPSNRIGTRSFKESIYFNIGPAFNFQIGSQFFLR